MTGPRRNRIAFVLTLFALAACAPVATVNKQTEEAAIRAIGQDWQRAVVARDVDRIVSFFTPDAVIISSNAPLVSGTAAVRTTWTGISTAPGLTLSWTPARIEITNPTTAIERGSYADSYDGPSGRISDSGSYVLLWRKIDGQWRVAEDIIVSSKPMTVCPTR
jgi:uncharacterized protein (TIGR02246 family)